MLRKNKKETNQNIDKKNKKAKKVKKEVDKGIVFQKRFKIILLISILIILTELIAMYLMNLSKDNNITYYDTLNSIHDYDDYYITSGSSNFKYSKYNDSFVYEYEDLNEESKPKKQVYAEQAKLVKLDKELNTVFESTFMGDMIQLFMML